MISTHPFITGALSGLKTLFKSCSEQVSKCYKLFPVFMLSMFPPLICFQTFFLSLIKDSLVFKVNSQKHWEVETLWEKFGCQVCRLWWRITTMGLSSLKIVGIWKKGELWRNMLGAIFSTPTFIQGPRHDLNTTKCYEIRSKVNILTLGVNLDFDTRKAYKKFNVNLVKFCSLFWELGWFVGYNIQITKTLPKKASSFICWQNGAFGFLHSYAPLYTVNCAGCSWKVESPMPKWTFSLWN